MTNSKLALKSNSSNSNKVPKKKTIQSEKSLSHKKPADTDVLTEKCAVQLTIDDEQAALKKPTSKSQTNKKNKNVFTRQNLQEKDQKQNKTSEQHNSTLDKSKKEHVSLAVNKKIINEENRVCHTYKTVTFNHKLTEYFSDLKVDEHQKNNGKELNSKKEAKINDKSTEKNFLSQKKVSDSPKNSPKLLKQRKSKSNVELTNHKVTDYFHIRRSERKYTKKIIDDKQADLENKILNATEDGLEIKVFESKGRGIVTTKEFYKGDFVIEYIGDLINRVTAKHREIEYAKNKNIGCYMYYFKHKNVQYCIDATKESGKLGRLINHSRKGNLVSRIVEVKQVPHLILFAKIDIPIGTEILYDYGDRSQESVRNYPWLTL